MATSGSIDFTLTALQIVEEAFKLNGVKTQEQPLQAPERADGFRTLNLMVKSWQDQGFHLWTRTEGILFLDVGKSDYFLGPSGDEATRFDDFVSAKLTVAAVATAVNLTVDSTAEMTALDNIGVELDDSSRQWTTIVSVDSPTTLTITDALTDSAAIDKSIYTFTDIIERPLRLTNVRRATVFEDNEIEVIKWSRSEYMLQVDKQSQGNVINYYYDPQLTRGRIYVWQTASSVNDFVRFTFDRTFEDFEQNPDNADFPVEWLNTIIYGLGLLLGIQYGTPGNLLSNIELKAQEFLENSLGWDQEPTSLKVVPITDDNA